MEDQDTILQGPTDLYLEGNQILNLINTETTREDRGPDPGQQTEGVAGNLVEPDTLIEGFLRG